MVASEQIVAAVADLEPRSRALLELATRRGMSDADMAALLRVRTADVQRLREQATLELAAALELEPDKLDVLRKELRRLDEADWERRAVLQAGRADGDGGRSLTRIVAAVVRLRVVGFLRPREGGYTVWLYNSPADAHRLAFTTFADFHGTLRLPHDFAKYRFVDISREVTDDRAHSDLSLLRAPLADLR